MQVASAAVHIIIRRSVMWKKIVLGFASIAVVSLISACNTIEGAGKDVSAGGQKVQEEAKETKQKM
jgi:entericidin B